MSTILDIIMSLDLTTISTFLLLLAGLRLFIVSRLRSNTPPGPFNLPIFGYVPSLLCNKSKVFAKLHKKYGDVVYFHLGATPVVALNSYDTIKEGLMLNPRVSPTRPNTFNTLCYAFENIGFGVENGKAWQDQRRFLMTAFRELGIGHKDLESQIQEEALVLLEQIRNKDGRPFDIKPLLECAIANIVSTLAFGIRYHYDDPKFHDLLKILVKYPTCISSFHLLNAFPYLRHILPGSLSGLAEIEDLKTKAHHFTKEKIQEHKQPTGTYTRDYTSIYLNKQLQDENNGLKDTSFNYDRLRINMITLATAGTTSTTSTLYWLFKMLIKHPEIQEKIHQEIDRVIGSERAPSLSDKPNMPYTDAFLMELQRFANVVPFGVPHSTTADTNIAGYHIPAGVTIHSQLFIVHMDPKIWGDPENFRPERFINDEGKVIKSDYLIPFAIGKRACPGENLAKTEMFIYMATLLQHLTFKPASLEEDVQIKLAELSLTRDLQPYKLRACSI